MTDPLLDIIGDKILEEYPEVDKRTCRLLGPTALVNLYPTSPNV